MSPLERYQHDIVARLESDPYFADISVYAIDSNTIEDTIDQALSGLIEKGGKIGAAVGVLMAVGDVDTPNLPGPQLHTWCGVRCQETPIFNRGETGTGKTAGEIALKASSLLHLWQPYPGQCVVIGKEALTPSLDFAPKVTYLLKPVLALSAEVLQSVKPVRPTIDATTITLASGTVGAAIWYTTDESYPAPTNPAALEYSGPIALTDAARYFRAAAYLAVEGWRASDVQDFNAPALVSP